MTDTPSEQPAASKDDVLERLVDDIEDSCDGYSASSVARAALITHVRAVERERDEHFNNCCELKQMAVDACAGYAVTEKRRADLEAELAVTKEALRVAGEERDALRMQSITDTGQLQEETAESRDWRITALHCRKQRDSLRAANKKLRGDLNIALLQRDAKLCSECPRTGELSALQAKAEMLAAGLSRIEDITHGTDYEGAAEDALDDILIEIEALAAYRGNDNE